MDDHDGYEFDGFRLLPARRQLLVRGQPARLGSRAYDLLLTLVEQRQRVVGKQELLEAVWPDDAVQESNLAVHVLALRKILGHAAIATVPGRGYRFTLPVSAPAAPPALAPRRSNLPEPVDELLGRAQELAALQGLVARHALVTVLGTGGVGKTRLAQRAAQALLHQFPDGVWWIELASLSDPALVAVTVARVLRASGSAGHDAVDAVASTLRAGGPALLVLDNAEHVLDGVVPLLRRLQQQVPQVHVLVTSQERLRLAGENTLRLAPLSLPADDSLQGARLSGAVALFEARARALDAGFRVEEHNRAAVVDICSRLDGIPLAIELAVARLPLLGLDGLKHRLDERFLVLTAHTRAALRRHETLRATLEWSHGLLGEAEQRVLRRLAVFAGGFTLGSAQRVAQDAQLDDWALLETLGSLVDKSLVVADGQPTPRYRLLETTRLYALERLAAAGEQALVAERHARAIDALLQPPRDDHRLWRTPPAPAGALVAELDNARAALDWVAASEDDTLALRLAAGASHAFLTAALNAEYLQRVLPLRDRVQAGVPPQVEGLFWARIALAYSRNAHPAGFEAGQRAAAIYRRSGDAGRLYDALTWTIAIGSRHGQVAALQPLVDEATRLEQPGWPPALRSSFRWACYRWLQAQGRTDEALQFARAQAELTALDGLWVTHVASGANVADCEITLGRLDRAESLARSALQALDAQGIDENIVGHVMDALMVTLVLQGRDDEAVAIGRRARRLLAREGDDLRLLDALALNSTTGGRWADAAQIAGHVDAAMAHSGEARWPSVARRRALLEERLDAALEPSAKALQLQAGALLSRERAFALAFGDAAG